MIPWCLHVLTGALDIFIWQVSPHIRQCTPSQGLHLFSLVYQESLCLTKSQKPKKNWDTFSLCCLSVSIVPPANQIFSLTVFFSNLTLENSFQGSRSGDWPVMLILELSTLHVCPLQWEHFAELTATLISSVTSHSQRSQWRRHDMNPFLVGGSMPWEWERLRSAFVMTGVQGLCSLFFLSSIPSVHSAKPFFLIG